MGTVTKGSSGNAGSYMLDGVEERKVRRWSKSMYEGRVQHIRKLIEGQEDVAFPARFRVRLVLQNIEIPRLWHFHFTWRS